MNNKETTKIALKVFSIYILAHVLISVPQLYGVYLAARGQPDMVEFPLVPFIVFDLILLIEIILARSIWKMSNNITTITSELSPEKREFKQIDLEAIILTAVGVYIFVEGVFELTAPLYQVFREITSAGIYEKAKVSGETIVWLLSEFGKACLGATLVVKMNGWKLVLSHIRGINRC